MRILMLNYEYPPIGGGASPITRALAEQLTAAGHGVDVVTMRYGKLPIVEGEGGLRVYRVPALRASPVRAVTIEMASYLAMALPWCLALTARRQYDLIHAHFIVPTGALAAIVGRLRNLPVVITAHGSDVPGYNPDRFGRGHKLLGPAWRAIARSAAMIISPSEYLGALIRKNCSVPVTIIPYGFDPPPARPALKTRRILFVSRLFPRKGAQYLLDALAGLPLDGWEITIAGDGPMLEPLREQARRLGLPVQFPGFLKGEALTNLYERSEIFVLPSLQDNFPVVLLEALSAGCAVITTSISGMPEVVGDAGLLVPPGDVAALRIAIKQLMNDDTLREQLGAAARRRIRELSWDGIRARHEQLYERVVRGERAALAWGDNGN
jgi:glycosyltransferase involved in cell wall biosynthesis